MSDIATYEDFLAHYGVVGMKWGKRKGGGGSTGPSRAELRTMDKAAKAENKNEKKAASAARDKEILDARAGLRDKAGTVKDAKKQYKVDRAQIGKVAARKILDEHKNEYLKQLDKANERTNKEQTRDMLLEIGGIVVSSLLK